jgi:Concanavalin A-like lectin/glucanases superfamily/Domain of unknown function (DUF2341)
MRSVILFLAAVPAAFGAWQNGYTYRRSLTVNASQVSGTQSNFPTLFCFNGSSAPCNNAGLSVPRLKTAANGGAVANTCAQPAPSLTVACDVIFTSDAAGITVLKFEWEKYVAATGESVVWVNVPSMSSGTTIYLWYGKASATTFQGNVTGVWDSSYTLVWHLRDGSTLSLTDSTGTVNGTNNGGTASAGLTGGGASFSGSQSMSTAAPVNLSGGQTATVEMWVNPTSLSTASVMFETSPNFNTSAGSILWDPAAEAGGKWGFQVSKGDNSNYNGVTLNTNPSAGSWHHVAMTADLSAGTGAVVAVYVDGAPAAVTQNHSSNLSGINLGSLTAYFMARNNTSFWQSGSVDEIRISATKRAAGWIAAEYNNQSAPAAFYAVGSEQIPGGATGYLILGRAGVTDRTAPSATFMANRRGPSLQTRDGWGSSAEASPVSSACSGTACWKDAVVPDSGQGVRGRQ